jgi:hypothetical protein
LLLLLALALAPFGRIGASQAMTGTGPARMTMHCGAQPVPDTDKGHRTDCTIACAAMTPPTAPFAVPPAAHAAPQAAPIPAFPPGIQPEADPPPPRLA